MSKNMKISPGNTYIINKLLSLLTFLFYLTAITSGELLHNHKFHSCNHQSETKGHISCKDFCPTCNFLAVNHSTAVVDYPLFIAARIQTPSRLMPNLIIVKQNEWACSIISRAPPSLNT